ncbi:hypothetical protein PR048_019620 [Dryococelus australis]|uniref:Uncharacterized protein n=1 Tax=Dryococelus australis TaxID=614101 RepID=A0ABQ9H3Z9_9NEOP|nr:hypothetical protein PR048_019620 [Dryococelus australis]
MKQFPCLHSKKAEEKKVLTKFTKLKEFGIGQIHLAADLFNPAAQGNKLKPTELIDTVGFICEVGHLMGLNVVKIRQDLADYRDKEGLWRCQFIWDGVANNELNPIL